MKVLRPAAVLAAMVASACYADILAVQVDGTVVNISSATGVGVVVGASGSGSLASMGYLNGKFYSQEPNGNLVTVNPNTGAAASTGVASNGIVALSNGPNGFLYGIFGQNAHSFLMRLDAANTWQTVGDTGFANVTGLVYSATGTMYGWDSIAGLVTVNTDTGVGADVNIGVPGSSLIDTLAFGPDGRLFGCGDSLYLVNLTGTTSLVGAGGYAGVRGMEFVRSKLLGVSSTSLYDIESVSGAGTLVGAAGFSGLTSMCRSGLAWVCTDHLASSFVFLNPFTGAGVSGPPAAGIRALAVGGDGNYYGIREGTGGNPDQFWKYVGASWLSVGSTGENFIEGLAYRTSDGFFYGWDTARGLVRIDPATGLATDVNAASDGDVLTATLEFGPDGTLYGAGDVLYKLDIATGVRTAVGPTLPAFIRGLASGPLAQNLNHVSTTLAPGSVLGGTPANLNALDGGVYDLRPGVVFSNAQAPISLTVSYTAPAPNPATLSAVVHSFGTSSNVSERVEAFQFSTATWVLLQFRPLPLSIVPINPNIADPGYFVGPSNEVRLRLSYKQTGAIFAYPWRAKLDAVWLQFTP